MTVLDNHDIECIQCERIGCTFGDYAQHYHRGSWRWQDRKPKSKTPTGDHTAIIHQTWKNTRIPTHLSSHSKSWRQHHPDWRYYLWTDDDNRDHIASHYPWFLDTYDSYPLAIQRVDAARYFIVYSLGGLYVDLDFRCFRNILPLIGEADLVLGLESNEHHTIHQRDTIIGNAFIYARAPGNPFLRHLIEEMSACSNGGIEERDNVLETTGPFMLTRAYENYLHKDEILLASSDQLYPLSYEDGKRLLASPDDDQAYARTTPAYAAHYHLSSWWDGDA